MKEFDALLDVAEKLLGPGGCPWDQKQTFSSLQPYVLEEAHEVIEAVDHNDDHKIIEELGDLLYTIVFYGKLAQKEGRFSMSEIIAVVKEKLIRRHPHVFGDLKVDQVEEVVQNWEKIKKAEKGAGSKESVLDGIPPTLPTLVKAQKMLKRMIRAQFPIPTQHGPLTEEEAGEKLIALIAHSEGQEIDLEGALRRALKSYEEQFRIWEKAKL